MYEESDSIDNSTYYPNGDIVWVKLSSYWWPGEVIHEENLPSDLLTGFRKAPLAIVKFFDEDSYEYVKNWANINPYNCSKKYEFIKKGMAGYRAKLSHMAKFPKDVGIAEYRTDGNPNILSHPDFLPTKKINYDEIFGTASPKKNPKRKLSLPSSKKTPVKDSNKPLITHRRFLGNDDYRAYICIQYPCKDRDWDSDEEEIKRLNEEPQKEFACDSCSFKTTRLEVMILHNKMHMQGIYITAKRKTKKSKGTEISDSESESLTAKSSKPKQRKKKEIVQPQIKDHFTNLLEEWDDTDEEIEETEERSIPKKKSIQVKKTSLNENSDADEDQENKNETEESSEKPNVTELDKPHSSIKNTEEDIKNCFDFDEEEEEEDLLLSTSLGRKIPRVIPEKPKANISELLEESQKDDSSKMEDTAKPKDKETTTKVEVQSENENNKKEILRISQSFNRESDIDDNFQNTFKELMQETELPALDDLAQNLKPEQNFHDARTIKFPDKGGTALKGGGTSKKRIVHSLEDFEAGFQKAEAERKRTELQLDNKEVKDSTSEMPVIGKDDVTHKTPDKSPDSDDRECSKAVKDLTKVQPSPVASTSKHNKNKTTKSKHSKTAGKEKIPPEELAKSSKIEAVHEGVKTGQHAEILDSTKKDNSESVRPLRRKTKQFVIEEDSEEIIEFTDNDMLEKTDITLNLNEETKEKLAAIDLEIEKLKKCLESTQDEGIPEEQAGPVESAISSDSPKLAESLAERETEQPIVHKKTKRRTRHTKGTDDLPADEVAHRNENKIKVTGKVTEKCYEKRTSNDDGVLIEKRTEVTHRNEDKIEDSGKVTEKCNEKRTSNDDGVLIEKKTEVTRRNEDKIEVTGKVTEKSCEKRTSNDDGILIEKKTVEEDKHLNIDNTKKLTEIIPERRRGRSRGHLVSEGKEKSILEKEIVNNALESIEINSCKTELDEVKDEVVNVNKEFQSVKPEVLEHVTKKQEEIGEDQAPVDAFKTADSSKQELEASFPVSKARRGRSKQSVIDNTVTEIEIKSISSEQNPNVELRSSEIADKEQDESPSVSQESKEQTIVAEEKLDQEKSEKLPTFSDREETANVENSKPSVSNEKQVEKVETSPSLETFSTNENLTNDEAVIKVPSLQSPSKTRQGKLKKQSKDVEAKVNVPVSQSPQETGLPMPESATPTVAEKLPETPTSKSKRGKSRKISKSEEGSTKVVGKKESQSDHSVIYSPEETYCKTRRGRSRKLTQEEEDFNRAIEESLKDMEQKAKATSSETVEVTSNKPSDLRPDEHSPKGKRGRSHRSSVNHDTPLETPVDSAKSKHVDFGIDPDKTEYKPKRRKSRAHTSDRSHATSEEKTVESTSAAVESDAIAETHIETETSRTTTKDTSAVTKLDKNKADTTGESEDSKANLEHPSPKGKRGRSRKQTKDEEHDSAKIENSSSKSLEKEQAEGLSAALEFTKTVLELVESKNAEKTEDSSRETRKGRSRKSSKREETQQEDTIGDIQKQSVEDKSHLPSHVEKKTTSDDISKVGDENLDDSDLNKPDGQKQLPSDTRQSIDDLDSAKSLKEVDEGMSKSKKRKPRKRLLENELDKTELDTVVSHEDNLKEASVSDDKISTSEPKIPDIITEIPENTPSKKRGRPTRQTKDESVEKPTPKQVDSVEKNVIETEETTTTLVNDQSIGVTQTNVEHLENYDADHKVLSKTSEDLSATLDSTYFQKVETHLEPGANKEDISETFLNKDSLEDSQMEDAKTSATEKTDTDSSLHGPEQEAERKEVDIEVCQPDELIVADPHETSPHSETMELDHQDKNMEHEASTCVIPNETESDKLCSKDQTVPSITSHDVDNVAVNYEEIKEISDVNKSSSSIETQQVSENQVQDQKSSEATTHSNIENESSTINEIDSSSKFISQKELEKETSAEVQDNKPVENADLIGQLKDEAMDVIPKEEAASSVITNVSNFFEDNVESEENSKNIPPKKNRWTRRNSSTKIDNLSKGEELPCELVSEEVVVEEQVVDSNIESVVETNTIIDDSIDAQGDTNLDSKTDLTEANSDTTLIQASSIGDSADNELILPPKKSKRLSEVNFDFPNDDKKMDSDSLGFPSCDDSILSASLRNNIEGLINDIDTFDNSTSSESLNKTSAEDTDIMEKDSAKDSLVVAKNVPPKKKKLEFPILNDHKDSSLKQNDPDKIDEKLAETIPQPPKKKMQKLFENSQALERIGRGNDMPLMSPLAKKKNFLFHQEELEQAEKLAEISHQTELEMVDHEVVVQKTTDEDGLFPSKFDSMVATNTPSVDKESEVDVDKFFTLPKKRKKQLSVSYGEPSQKKEKRVIEEISELKKEESNVTSDSDKISVDNTSGSTSVNEESISVDVPVEPENEVEVKLEDFKFNIQTNLSNLTPSKAEEFSATVEQENKVEVKLEEDDFKFTIQTNLTNLSTSKAEESSVVETSSEIKNNSTKEASDLDAEVSVESAEVTQSIVEGEESIVSEPVIPEAIVCKETEFVPISVTPTVMSEKDLDDAQVEITSDKVISEKKPTSLGTFSVDFIDTGVPGKMIPIKIKKPESTTTKMSSTLGTEFTSKAMTKEFDNRPLMTQPKAYALKSELLDILEGNSNSSTNSSGSDQKFKTSFDNYDKRNVVQGMFDFEEAIPSQIVLSNKVSPGTVLLDSPKLLERLSVSSDTPKSKKVVIQSDVKVSDGKNLATKIAKPMGVPRPGQKIIIKTSKSQPIASVKTVGNKPIILSEQIIRPANAMKLVTKSAVSTQGVKRQYEDIEDVETAFIIPKIAKKTAEDEVAGSVTPEKPVVKGRAAKTGGKAKIIQQTIITPKGEIIQPKTATSTNTPTATKTVPIQAAQSQQDDTVFDINSMPIVLSDDLLTPESIQNMPVVLSEEMIPQTKTVPVKVEEKQPVVTKKVVGPKQIIFKTTQSAGKQMTKPRILSNSATPPNKVPKPGTTALLAAGTSTDGKPTKYVLVPSSATPNVQQVKTVKQTVVKKVPVAQSKIAAVQPNEPPSQVMGNKIMIVTNQHGQQTRVVLTPQQQKAFMQAQPGSKTKTIIKGAIPKALLESATAVAGPSGVVHKTTIAGVLQGTSSAVSSQGGLLMTVGKNVKAPVQPKKVSKTPSKPQKTILIKNQLGQTVRKIQGTDDADLDRQVMEQLEAIKASSKLQQANKPPEIINYTNRPIPSANTVMNRSTIRRSYSKKVDPVKVKPPVSVSQPQEHSSTETSSTSISPQPKITQTQNQTTPAPQKKPIQSVIEPTSTKLVDSVPQTTTHAKSDSKTSTTTAGGPEKPTDRPLTQLVIQDGLGNQTTITEGQILAIPSETVDGQPQSYMLVTLDEMGNITPLNNEALMSLDPSLGLGGDLNNMVLQVDQGQGTVASIKPAEPNVPAEALPATNQNEHKKTEEKSRAEPKIVLPPVPELKPILAEPPKTQELPMAVEQQVVIGEGVLPGADAGGQQLIVTGDPIATQKFLESLSDGSTDLANILANAEGGSVLIQADGQQILIKTNTGNQSLLGIAESTEGGGNPIFGTHKPNQDILAAALANTDVFQPTDQQTIHPSVMKSLQSSQLSPVSGAGVLYPMHVGNVLETSLTLSSPIMTPLEVPSIPSKKIDDDVDILNQVPKNVDLPITITDPSISQTVAQQQAIGFMELNHLIGDIKPTGPIDMDHFKNSLTSLDESLASPAQQKSFNGSMPLLTEEVTETENRESSHIGKIRVAQGLEGTNSNFGSNFGSITSETVESSREEVAKTSSFGEIASLPILTEDVIEDSGSSIGSTKQQRPSPKPVERDIVDEGLSTLGGEMCSSLSEPPPDMFDLASITCKEEEISSDISSIPEPEGETLSLHSDNSGEIPIQPPIVANLNDLKRPAEETEEPDEKRQKID